MSGISNISSQLANFPIGGERKQGAQAGIHVLDFANGLVKFPDGSQEAMSNSLGKMEKNFIRSVLITVSTVDAIIKIGQNVLPKSHQLTYVVNGINFENMSIEFPVDRTPLDDFSYLVIGSDSPVFPIDSDVLVGSHNPEAKIGTTTDAFVTIVDFNFVGFSSSEIIIENTLGVNIMTSNIEVSEDGVNWVSAQGFPLDVPINDFTIYQNSINHRYIRVSVKSKNAGQATDYRVQLNLER